MLPLAVQRLRIRRATLTRPPAACLRRLRLRVHEGLARRRRCHPRTRWVRCPLLPRLASGPHTCCPSKHPGCSQQLGHAVPFPSLCCATGGSSGTGGAGCAWSGPRCGAFLSVRTEERACLSGGAAEHLMLELLQCDPWHAAPSLEAVAAASWAGRPQGRLGTERPGRRGGA